MKIGIKLKRYKQFKVFANVMSVGHFLLLLSLVFAHPLSAGKDSDGETLPSLSSRVLAKGDDTPAKRGSLKLRRQGSAKDKIHRLTPGRRGNKHQASSDEEQAYKTLKASLGLQKQQIDWLNDWFVYGTSSGILFRNEDTTQRKFFKALRYLYGMELKFLPLLMERGESKAADTELFQDFTKQIRSFMRYSQRLFESLEIVFWQANEDLERKQFYYDQFSKGFKTGRIKTTDVRPDPEEKSAGEARAYTTSHVKSMIGQIYNQYYFFSKTLPLFMGFFETQLLMGGKIEPFIIDRQEKDRFKRTFYHQTDRQQQLRKTMESLLGDYQRLLGLLNPVVTSHGENPLLDNPALYEANVCGKFVFTSLEKVMQKQEDEAWVPQMRKRVQDMESEFQEVLERTARLFTDPEADGGVWGASPNPHSATSSSPDSQIRKVKSEHRNSSQRLAQFRRTLSKRSLRADIKDEPEERTKDVSLRKHKKSDKLKRTRKHKGELEDSD